METRAKFVLMGLFTLAVIVGGFWFTYWLRNTGGFHERATYLVRFDTSVGGLISGAGVLFNGIRVGDVTGLALNPEKPLEVNATIAIEPSTPVRADTRVGLDYKVSPGFRPSRLSAGRRPCPR